MLRVRNVLTFSMHLVLTPPFPYTIFAQEPFRTLLSRRYTSLFRALMHSRLMALIGAMMAISGLTTCRRLAMVTQRLPRMRR